MKRKAALSAKTNIWYIYAYYACKNSTQTDLWGFTFLLDIRGLLCSLAKLLGNNKRGTNKN